MKACPEPTKDVEWNFLYWMTWLFGSAGRDDNRSSLGRLIPTGKKLPEGNCGIAHWDEEMGLAFGLWMRGRR